MGKAPPAYQYYPDEFEQGTAAMTTSEVGGYQRLLNYQWQHLGVPGDNLRAMSAIMRCTQSQARSIWTAISAKFIKHEANDWRNARLEREREKQARYRDEQAARGRASGAARRNAGSNGGSSMVRTGSEPDTQPKANSPSPFPSPSPSNPSVPKSLDPTTTTVSGPATRASSPLITSPLQFEKAREKFAFFGSRLKVPHVLHAECRDKLGGDNPEAMLQAWYLDLNDAVEITREPVPDIFEWLRPRFVAWAKSFAADVELEKYRPKGA